jgi:hypothetical protein
MSGAPAAAGDYASRGGLCSRATTPAP